VSLLQLDGISRRYDTSTAAVLALQEVTFSLEEGEVVGVFGPSGSGKTTLLNIVIGWDQPSSGTVTMPPDMPEGWRGLAVVPQALGLVAELTAAANVELAAGGANVGDDVTVAPLLEALGLHADEVGRRLPARLSLGQQQRVAVARALIASPRLLVADEPTAHQDEENADRVFDAFGRLAGQGGAVLVSTHDPRLLDRLSRVIELADGRLIDPSGRQEANSGPAGTGGGGLEGKQRDR
jgi:putative ABC transport system ATP-binding protein